MYKDIVGRFIARKFQHGWPEQGMKINDVFANEMDLLDGRVGKKALKVNIFQRKVAFQGSQIPHRSIEPDIKIFTRCVRYGNAEVRRIA